MRGDADGGAPFVGQRDPRRPAWHAVVRISTRGAAHADEPITIAPRTRLSARCPAESLAPGLPGLDDAALGEGQARRRILFRLIPDPQFDRIHAHGVGELIHAGFQPKGADRLSRRTHKSIGRHIHFDGLDVEQEASGSVRALRRQYEGFRHVVVRRHGDRACVNQSVQSPVCLGA